MAINICGTYWFGTDEGVVQKSVSRDVRLRKIGHWSGNIYQIDCEIVESVQATHNVVYFAGASGMGTAPEKILPSSIMLLSAIQIDWEKEDMTKFTYTWQEMLTTGNCSMQDITWAGPSGGTCCFGAEKPTSRATYREQADMKIIMGPTGKDGSSETNPLTALIFARPMGIKKTFSWTVEQKQGTAPTSISVSSAMGGCQVSLTGKATQYSENESMNGFKTWTYGVEKTEQMS